MNTITIEKPADNASDAKWAAYGKQQHKVQSTLFALKPGDLRIMQVDPAKVTKANAEKVAAGDEPSTPTLFLNGSVVLTVKEAEAALKVAKKAKSDVISVECKANGWRNKVTNTSSVCARFKGTETDAVRALRKDPSWKANSNGSSEEAIQNAL